MDSAAGFGRGHRSFPNRRKACSATKCRLRATWATLPAEAPLSERPWAKRAARERAGDSASDGRGELLRRQNLAFQAIREFGPDTHLVLDTNLPVRKLVDRVIRKLPVKPARGLR